MPFSTLNYGNWRRRSSAPTPALISSPIFASSDLSYQPYARDDMFFDGHQPYSSENNAGQFMWQQPEPTSYDSSDYFSHFLMQQARDSASADSAGQDVPMLSSAPSSGSAPNSPHTPYELSPPQTPEIKIARPPNAWILYRSDKLSEVRASQTTVKTPQAELSKMIGERWRAESADVKKKYEIQAAQRKQAHEIAHPGYKFSPKKKGEKSVAAGPKSPSKTRTIPLNRKTRNRAANPVKRPRPSRAKIPPPTPSTMFRSLSIVDGERMTAALTAEPDLPPKSIPEVKAELNAIWNKNEQDLLNSPEDDEDQIPVSSPTEQQFFQPGSYQSETWFTPPTTAHTLPVNLPEQHWALPATYCDGFAMPLDPQLYETSPLSLSFPGIAAHPSHQLFADPAYPSAEELDMISPFAPPSPSYTFPARNHNMLHLNLQAPAERVESTWWRFRNIKVRRDDVDGVELQELLRQLQQEAQQNEAEEIFLM